MPYRFEIFKDKTGKHRFNFKAPNGEIMFSSQGYADKSGAKKTIRSLQKNVGAADVVDAED